MAAPGGPRGTLQRRPSASFMRDYMNTARKLRTADVKIDDTYSDGESDLTSLGGKDSPSASPSFHDTNPFSSLFGKPLSRSTSEDHLTNTGVSSRNPHSISPVLMAPPLESPALERQQSAPVDLAEATGLPRGTGGAAPAALPPKKKKAHRRSQSNPFFHDMVSPDPTVNPFFHDMVRPEPADDAHEVTYGEVTEIGGLPYDTWVPTGDVLSIEVQTDMSRSDAEGKLANGPAGGYVVRWSSGKDRVRVISVKGPLQDQFQHLKVMEMGGKFRIPPSTVETDSLEDLVRHFYRVENNDVLVCPLTLDVCRERHASSVAPLRAKKVSSTSTTSTCDSRRHSSQANLLTVNDWDSPNCLRCGKRLNKQASKRYWCQACDVPVCGDCSSRRLEANKTLRVCSMCYELNCDTDDLVLRHRPRPMPYLVACGYLVTSDSSSRKWARRYCTLDSNGVLMYFKPGRTMPRGRVGPDDGGHADGAASPTAATMQGWFIKDSHTKLGKRRKRFFVLVDLVLHYYVRATDGGTGDEWKGSIELSASSSIQVPPDRDGKVLRIDTRDTRHRAYVLEATGSGDMSAAEQVEAWAAALKSVVADLNAKASSRRTSTLSGGGAAAGDGTNGVPNIGPLVGAMNIAEQCALVVHHPSSKGWPTASKPACRFSIEMDSPNKDARPKVVSFIGVDPATAHEWRAMLSLVAKCCYGCGKPVVTGPGGAVDGRVAQCCAVSDLGLLYHFDCFGCCECPCKRKNSSVSGKVVLPTELLSVVGDNVYCDKHARPRRQQAKDRDEAVVELLHVSYRVLPEGKDLDTFVQTVLRKSALLLVSGGEADSTIQEEPVELSGGIEVLFTPEELRKAPQAVLLDIMGRLKDKTITELAAVRELRNVVDDDGTLDVLRYLVVGQRHLFAHAKLTEPADGGSVEVVEETADAVKLRVKVNDADRHQLPNTGVKQFEIVSHRPATFQKIRRASGIDEDKWRESFGVAPGPSNLLSGGASGCFVVSTPNDQYVMKDMRGSEREVLLSMLPQYLAHIEAHPGTLLTRIIGLFEVKVADTTTSVVVMTSVLSYHTELKYSEIYDLKGSFVGRKAIGSTRKDAIMQSGTFSGTRKDLDLRRNLVLHDADECDLIKRQLQVDTLFLQKLQLMDYSLVLAIHIADDPEWTPAPRPTGPQGWISRGFLGTGPEPHSRALHLVGIIDFLQRWNAAKVMENTLKSSFMGQDKHGISAVNPEEYAKRFRSVLSGRFEAEAPAPV